MTPTGAPRSRYPCRARSDRANIIFWGDLNIAGIEIYEQITKRLPALPAGRSSQSRTAREARTPRCIETRAIRRLARVKINSSLASSLRAQWSSDAERHSIGVTLDAVPTTFPSAGCFPAPCPTVRPFCSASWDCWRSGCASRGLQACWSPVD